MYTNCDVPQLSRDNPIRAATFSAASASRLAVHELTLLYRGALILRPRAW